MIPALEAPEILIKEFYLPAGRAKHTEQEKVFQIYSDIRNNDLLLCDLQMEIDRECIIIPAHFQKPELTNTIWEHFKSAPKHLMMYLVHGLGIDLDHLERFVLYSPRYESGQQQMWNEGVTCLVRPEEMFFSEVIRDGYKGPRFRRIQ